MPTLDEMVAVARAWLVRLNAKRIRRLRYFTVKLVDPFRFNRMPQLPPQEFAEPYERILRPLLQRATVARIFFEYDRPAPGGEISSASLRVIQEHGADADFWRRTYLTVDTTGEGTLHLTPTVLSDTLFWWWLVCEWHNLWPVFVVPTAQFEAASFFPILFNPQCVTGVERSEPAPARALQFAKAATAKGTNVAFLARHHRDLAVVAKASHAEQLFREAVEQCQITEGYARLAWEWEAAIGHR